MKDINRLKIVLVEKKKTGRRLADQTLKNRSTVYKWWTRVSKKKLIKNKDNAD